MSSSSTCPHDSSGPLPRARRININKSKIMPGLGPDPLTVAQLAVIKNDAEMLKIILRANPRHDIPHRFGSTLLLLAVNMGSLDCAFVLGPHPRTDFFKWNPTGETAEALADKIVATYVRDAMYRTFLDRTLAEKDARPVRATVKDLRRFVLFLDAVATKRRRASLQARLRR